MRAAVATVLSAAPALARDIAAVTGVGLISYGAWLAYEPAGYVSLGVMLLAISIISARRAD